MVNRIGNRLYAVIGLIGAVITIVPWALSNTVRVWVRDHSNWLYGALVLVVLAVVIILGYARDLKRENKELKASGKRPSRNDVNMLRGIMAQIPKDGATMTWLKTGFLVKSIPSASMDAVDQICQSLSMNPLEFDNWQVNDAYENFRVALEDFSTEVTRATTFEDRNYQRLHVPLPTREEQEKSYTIS